MLAADASKEIKNTATDLQALIYESTGVTLPIVYDNNVSTYSASSKVISLGETAYAEATSVAAPEDLSDYGYVIKTVDNSIFINSHTDIGVTFGAYGFLERQFNFECFNDDFYTIDALNAVGFKDYAVEFESDMNVVDYGSHYVDGVGMRRMSYTQRSDIIVGTSVHNSLKIVPYATYGSQHPKWFVTEWSLSQGTQAVQLCYTAGGRDTNEYKTLVQTVADALVSRLNNNPQKDFILFSQMDKNVWCGCSGCKALIPTYGENLANSASLIMFMNDVAAEIDKVGLDNPRDYKILYLVYQKTVDAPVKYNTATGKYEAIDEKVIPAAHTVPIFAQTAINYHLSIHDPANAEYKERILKWQALTMEHGMGVYTYFTNYINYWLYYDSYTYMQELYQFYAQGNVQWFYEEGQYGNEMKGGTAWSALRTYLSSNLAKDATQDINVLTENFFKKYYGEAWEDMLKVFNATRAEFQKHKDSFTNKTTSPPFINIDSKEFWSYDFALEAFRTINSAIDKVTDEQIKKNITAECVSYCYIISEYYATEYGKDTSVRPEGGNITAMRKRTREYANLSGITMIAQNGRNDKYTNGLATDVWKRWNLPEE